MRRPGLFAVAVFALALAVPTAVFGHAERKSYFPDPNAAKVPVYRTTGPRIVVCKADSRARIKRRLRGGLERRNLALLERCRFRHIQQAVNAARNGTRILILPGIYREEPSRAKPNEDPRCEGMYDEISFDTSTHNAVHEGVFRVPSYDYQRNCPNGDQLIAITGDDGDPDRVCDDKCHIQIEGTGRRGDVLIVGDKNKRNVIKADRADGVYLRNFTIEYARENNIYIHETNGFNVNGIESRWAFRYGVLSFTSDNGLYQHIDTYGNGDSGVYPGSGPECRSGATGNRRYGIEIRNVDSHHNLIGYSGTAGNGVWAHDNRFRHNTTGVTTDSFVPGHPGMPQDCAKFQRNRIYSNNYNLYSAERDEYCKRPEEQRDPKKVCPHFATPLGTGILIAGGNSDVVRSNYIYDNWRDGVRLFWVPAAARFELDPLKQYDTSHNNVFESNVMGRRPLRAAQRRSRPRRAPAFTGAVRTVRAPNGVDFWWDEEGRGNCWRNNTGPNGAATADFQLACPAATAFTPLGNPQKISSQATCASWDRQANTDPPACDWFTLPPRPR